MTAKSRRYVKRVSYDCSAAVEPSMTKQSFRDECDINVVMAKYERTGLINFSNDMSSGRFVDLASAPDYHSSMNLVLKAQAAFDSLPSKIRSTFNNDPSLFLAFVSDPANQEKAYELGLAKRPPASNSEPSGEGVPPAAAGVAPLAAGASSAPKAS